MSTTTPSTLRVLVRGGTATVIDEDGGTDTVLPGPVQDIRQAVITHAARLAHDRDEPIKVMTSGDRGEHHLMIEPDGRVRAISPQADPPGFTEPEAPATPAAPVPDRTPGPEVSGAAVSESPAHARTSFIQVDTDAALASSPGMRGWFRRIGVVRGPSAAEIVERERIRMVSAQWAGPRLVAVVNGKGGVGKTPTTAMLSAVYARHGGGSVLAFDNNDTRGTLGWRTEPGTHDATIADLLAAAPELATMPTSALAAFIHHQTDDRYDVLRSNPRVLSADQRLTMSEFDALVTTVTRGYRLVVFDSGNDESADRWSRMIDWAGQLVVPTLTSPESAESAALLLEALAARDERSALLARDAVVVITQAEPTTNDRLAQLVGTFRQLARAVTVVPFDPALKSGALRFGALRPPTQRAWIAAAAHTAEKF